QGFGEHGAGRSDEGVSSAIFLVSRLLAHEHDARVGGALAEDGLGGSTIEGTGLAVPTGRGQRRQR
ncbi:MAG: hypothetical protein JWM82_2060, partial [Myxococcales bacterium]|nr:hypothetical protein [Myxococcales bacterium]